LRCDLQQACHPARQSNGDDKHARATNDVGEVMTAMPEKCRHHLQQAALQAAKSHRALLHKLTQFRHIALPFGRNPLNDPDMIKLASTRAWLRLGADNGTT